MKKMNMGFMLLVGVLIVAVVLVVYRYLYPTQPWLEGFQGSATPILKSEAIESLIFLNKAYNNVSKTRDNILTDMPTISSCPTNTAATNIGKACYGGLLNKYGIDPTLKLSETPDVNLSIEQARITMNVLRDYEGVFGHIKAIDFTTMLSNTKPQCEMRTVGDANYIGPRCYNILLGTYRGTKGTAPDTEDTTDAEDTEEVETTATSAKDYRVSFFKNLSLIAGYTNLKTDAIETAYDKMKSCAKDSNEYDIDCFHELADEFNINITKEAMNSVGVSTKTKSKSAAEKTIDDALKALKDTKASAAEAKKCTVEFGKKPEIVPQTGAASESKPNTTCVTTGDVVKETKTPAVEQGCDFANKMPKINVINLRDYVHKDEIPCWSCKL